MSNTPLNNHPFLNEITKRLSDNQAAVMVGSGFSKNATPLSAPISSFPDWFELGDVLYNRLDPANSTDPKFFSIPEIASELAASMGPAALHETLYDAIPDDDFEPSPLHERLLDLRWSDVFTTNYDTLLDRAVNQVPHRDYTVVIRPSQLVYSTSPRVIKLHGCISNPSSCILTHDQYRTYPDHFSPFVNTVCQSLVENTLCLVGFSGRDPNFVNWIYWALDGLGREHTPKVYLVTVSPLTHTQHSLLTQRNISIVDMSDHGTSKDTPYTRMQAFFEYLEEHTPKSTPVSEPAPRPPATPVRWPIIDTKLREPQRDLDIPTHLSNVTNSWAQHRSSYPGWIVLPDDRRQDLWRYTDRWINYIVDNHDPRDASTFALLFELTWRMEKCLCPLFDNLAAAIASFVDTFPSPPRDRPPSTQVSSPSSDPTTAALSPDNSIESLRNHLLLALLRYHREEGESQDWQRRHDQLWQDLPRLSAQHQADFYYEKSLYALFDMNLRDLRSNLAAWPTNYQLPFSEAKRAGLLAEAGASSDALATAKQSLDCIRSQLQLRDTIDYSLMSQESYVMVLVRYLRRAERFREGQFTPEPSADACFSDRWDALKQETCDPWNDLGILERSLEADYVKPSRTVDRKSFDIGVVTRSVALGGVDGTVRHALVGYQFVRLFEDIGLPFRVPGGSFSLKAARGAILRIADSSLYWAITTAARIADDKTVDRLFDRARIAHWTRTHNDNMIQRFLAWDRRNDPGRISHSRLYDTNIAVSFARVMPELLSRICCKCSAGSKQDIVEFLHRAYSLGNATPYRGIDKLAERLLNSFSVCGRLAIIPQLIDFPVPENLIRPLEHEMRNPLLYLSVPRHELRARDVPPIPCKNVELLLHAASDVASDVRESALWSLQVLHYFELLNDHQSQEYAELLWSETDDNGFPVKPKQSPFIFLELPHPPNVDVVGLFKEYVRRTAFPEQGSKSGVALHSTWEIGLVADLVASSARIEWNDEEIGDIVDRLVSWWNSDRRYLSAGDETAPFASLSLQFRLRFRGITKTIAAISRPGIRFGERHERDLLCMISQMREHGIPTLQAEAAIVHMFGDKKIDVVQSIEDAMSAEDDSAIVDAMEAIRELLDRSTDVDIGLTHTVIGSLGQMNRWASGTQARHAIDVSADLAMRYPHLIAGEFERSTLIGLRRIANYTAVDGGDLEFSDKLVVRESAAALAYRLYEFYVTHRDRDKVPEELEQWNAICQSEDEFDEIRSQWASAG